MTPKRWQFIGSGLMGWLYIALAWQIFFHWDFMNVWGWVGSLGAGILGNAVGEWVVKAWQEAGE
jgi:hypothetical protein